MHKKKHAVYAQDYIISIKFSLAHFVTSFSNIDTNLRTTVLNDILQCLLFGKVVNSCVFRSIQRHLHHPGGQEGCCASG